MNEQATHSIHTPTHCALIGAQYAADAARKIAEAAQARAQQLTDPWLAGFPKGPDMHAAGVVTWPPDPDSEPSESQRGLIVDFTIFDPQFHSDALMAMMPFTANDLTHPEL